MTMSATRLGDAMKAAVDGVGDPADRTAVFRALATAIIAEIQGFAVVTTVVATTGTAAAQSGTGTGTPPTTGVR